MNGTLIGRIRVCLHILRGRSVVFRLRFPNGIYLPLGTKHLTISECDLVPREQVTLLTR